MRDYHSTLCESNSDVEDSVGEGVRCNGKDRDRGGGRMGPPECLDVADILGCSWDVLIDAGDEIIDGGQVNEGSSKDGGEQLNRDHVDADCEIEANISTSIQSNKENKPSVKTKGRYNKWRKKKSQDNDNEDLQSLGATKKEQEQAVTNAGGHVSSKGLSKASSGSFFQAMKKKRHTDSPVVIDISVTADEDADADVEMSLSDALSVSLQEVKKKNKTTAFSEEEEEDALLCHTVGENGQGFPDKYSDPDQDLDPVPNVDPRAVPPESGKASDRFVCTLADLILPICNVCSQNQGQKQSQCQGNICSKDNTGNCINTELLPQMTSTSTQVEGEGGELCSRGTVYEGWQYECMMVEVKGPTDSLADHQLMWLCVLSSSNIATFVAHVKETSLVE